MVIDWIGDVLAKGTVVAVLLAGAGWLFKQQIAAWLNKDLEREKSELQKDVEALKADFGRLHTEHSVRFTALHVKRAEVIAELYSLLVKSLWAAEALLQPMEFASAPSKGERSVLAQNRIAKAYRFFERHRIYLPPAVCDAFDRMLQDIRSPVIRFTVYLAYTDDQMQDHTFREKHEAWTAGYQAIRDEIPKARALLETEFRMLLGDEILSRRNHENEST